MNIEQGIIGKGAPQFDTADDPGTIKSDVHHDNIGPDIALSDEKHLRPVGDKSVRPSTKDYFIIIPTIIIAPY